MSFGSTWIVNTQLLKDALEVIKLRPGNWDQAAWAVDGDGENPPDWNHNVFELLDDKNNPACGTSFCLAGWACVLSGKKPNWYQIEEGGQWIAEDTTDGRSIRSTARMLLGLHPSEADELFYSENSLEYLEERIAELIGEEES